MRTELLSCKDELVSFLENKGFIGVDSSVEESLFEYGSVLEPKTGFVLYARALKDNPQSLPDYIFDYTFVDKKGIIDYITDAADGFFSFIGENRESLLKDHYIPDVIQSANMYDGYFQESCIFDMTAEEALENCTL